MRPCKVQLLKWERAPDGEYRCYDRGYEATFHQWGQLAKEDSDGNVAWTVGLVEKCDGHMILVDPDDIQFLDRNNKAPKCAEGEQDAEPTTDRGPIGSSDDRPEPLPVSSKGDA